MNANFKQFLDRVKRVGLANASRFMIELTPPRMLADSMPNDIMLFAKSVQVGGESVSVKTFRGLGRPDVFATSLNVAPDFSISFYLGRDWREYSIFKKWVQGIGFNSDRLQYPIEYISPIMKISALDRSDNIVATDTCLQVFPTSVGKTELDHANSSTVPITNILFVRKST